MGGGGGCRGDGEVREQLINRHCWEENKAFSCMDPHWLGQFDKPIVFSLDREKEIRATPSTPKQSLTVF